MATIGFIGLGNMGGPMAANLAEGGHAVSGYDVAPDAGAALAAAGGRMAASVAGAVAGAEIVFTMLPAGTHVESVCTGPDGIFASAAPGTLVIDCSTIEIATARRLAETARSAGFVMLDAPVSGGVAGAAGRTLTFMVGGDETGFAAARPVLAGLGRTIVHCGGPGNGQAAKTCNNMILGVSMIAVSEAFALADRIGLDRQVLFDVASKSSGQCWSLTTYCPVPGPVPASPANRGYKAGFAAAMMLKDLRLAAEAAAESGAATPLGAAALGLYEEYCRAADPATDFSGIFELVKDLSDSANQARKRTIKSRI